MQELDVENFSDSLFTDSQASNQVEGRRENHVGGRESSIYSWVPWEGREACTAKISFNDTKVSFLHCKCKCRNMNQYVCQKSIEYVQPVVHGIFHPVQVAKLLLCRCPTQVFDTMPTLIRKEGGKEQARCIQIMHLRVRSVTASARARLVHRRRRDEFASRRKTNDIARRDRPRSGSVR